MLLAPGVRLGPYEVRELIGRGGMGEVYRAWDERLGREVAVKILAAHLGNEPESLARFRREARAVAALSHPNVVAVFDVGSEGDTQYVVTELLEGETLRARLKRGPMSAEDAAKICAGIADGLAAAHERGIVHRDLKPENVFLTSSGGVKLVDFGLAITRTKSDEALTAPGVLLGTAGYMSPEQLRSETATPASDIFAFGCVAYEMLVSEMPFRRDSDIEVHAAVLRDTPDLDRLPPLLRGVVARCLEKKPQDRYADGGALAADLHEAIAAGAPTVRTTRRRNRRTLPWIAVAVIASLGIVVALLVIVQRRRVIDAGYDLRFSDVTGDSETRRLLGLALRADAAGNRSEAIALLDEAATRDPHAPLPVAFLSSFLYFTGNVRDAARWNVELRRRMPFSRSAYETLLCRYLLAENASSEDMALSASLLALRPNAWRLRLSLAHLHLARRELPAALAELKQIDVRAPDDRRLTIVLADRASLGDVAGATRDLQRSRLMQSPALLAYTRGRIAWSSGRPVEAARQFETAVETATVANLGAIAMESRILAGVAWLGAGDPAKAQTAFDLAAFEAHRAQMPTDELQADAFGAYLAWRRGDADGFERRLRLADALAGPDSVDATALLLLGMRMHSGPMPGAPAVRSEEIERAVATLLRAREAWARGDRAGAARLLQESRTEGIDVTWFSEEAALLAYDLGAPPRAFKADPPYPNRLRFIAIWELEHRR